MIGSSEADVASSVKGRLQNGTISESQIPGLEYVVFVKGSGPYTIDYGYEPDKPPKEVIVSRKCAEAVLRGAQVRRFSAFHLLSQDFYVFHFCLFYRFFLFLRVLPRFFHFL